MPHIAFTVSSFLGKNVDQYSILVFNNNLLVFSCANLKDHLRKTHFLFLYQSAPYHFYACGNPHQGRSGVLRIPSSVATQCYF